MRKVGNCLYELLPVNIPDLVDKKCKDKCKGESEKKIFDIDDKSIGESLPESMISHELLEVTESAPLFTEDVTAGTILSESYYVTEHRNVSEDNIIDHRNDDHYVELPVTGKVFLCPLTAGKLTRLPIKRLIVLHINTL